jgi:superfamily II DNA/RNA helicase
MHVNRSLAVYRNTGFSVYSGTELKEKDWRSMNEEFQKVFAGIELVPDVKRAMDGMGFVKATPVQEKTIPAFLE